MPDWTVLEKYGGLALVVVILLWGIAKVAPWVKNTFEDLIETMKQAMKDQQVRSDVREQKLMESQTILMAQLSVITDTNKTLASGVPALIDKVNSMQTQFEHELGDINNKLDKLVTSVKGA